MKEEEYIEICNQMLPALFAINEDPKTLLKVLPILTAAIIIAAVKQKMDVKRVPEIMKGVTDYVIIALEANDLA